MATNQETRHAAFRTLAGGTTISPAVMETGFFANVAIHDDKLNIAALEAADQKPKTPQRVFG